MKTIRVNAFLKAIAILTLATSVPGQSGGIFEIRDAVVGGGAASASNGNFEIDTIVGQPASGGALRGAFFSVTSGFWTFTLPAPAPGYNFTGFFAPVENMPTLNIASEGSAVPVKFSLSGDQGLAVFASDYPASSPVTCDANEPGSEVSETVNAGGSSLTYDAATDQYTYIWKTNRSWRGTCRILVVRFNDNSQYLAKFRFR
jgi:hypothetical protein